MRKRSFLLAACVLSGWTMQAQAQSSNPEIRAVEDKVVKARPLPVEAIRLTGGPLKAALDADAAFVLTVDPDRAMSAFRTSAGLPAKGEPLGGWDGAVGRQLTGHMAGHLLSAHSLLYAATGDEKFKQKADYMVAELAAIQEKDGEGFIGGQQDARRTPEKELFKQVEAGNINANGENLNGMWSPWYVKHKLFAGLRDAYRHAGNKTALEVEIKLAAWAERTLARLNDEQLQKMLNGEFGGMNEVLADLYADTGDKRWLELSYKFEHKAFVQPLAEGKDLLGNVHGNHNIPKLGGSAARYAYAAKAEDLAASDFFWKAVVDHHTFATGGNSGAAAGEYFPQPDKLAAMIAAAPAAQTNESCNVYNMLKLTRRLFSFQPDARYADFMERAIFNHALAQINPANGVMAYHVPVGQGVRRDYQGNAQGRINTAFTCCVGSGMENPALFTAGMYCHAGDKLWVNYYAPSTAEWKERGAKLTLESDMPEGDLAKFTLTLNEPKTLTLMLRRPAWAGPGFKVSVNGAAVAIPAMPLKTDVGTPVPMSSYVEIARTWKTGDTVELLVPKDLRLEPTPDDPAMAAIMWGPLVLALDMGVNAPARGTAPPARAAGRGPVISNSPVIVTAAKSVPDWLKPVAGQPLQFRAEGAGRTIAAPTTASDLNFVPLYRLHDRTYSVYMNIYAPDAWAQKTAGGQ